MAIKKPRAQPATPASSQNPQAGGPAGSAAAGWVAAGGGREAAGRVEEAAGMALAGAREPAGDEAVAMDKTGALAAAACGAEPQASRPSI